MERMKETILRKETPIRICKVRECVSKHHAQGYCGYHYRKFKRSGKIDTVLEIYNTPEESLEARTMPVTETGCILWFGANNNGYGTIRINGKNKQVHRYVWEKNFREIPNILDIDHRCHTPFCVNIDHLRTATRQQNARNKSGANKNSVSKYRNISWDNRVGKWLVQLTNNSKYLFFKHFDNIYEAIEVAEQKRKEFYLEFSGKG